MIPSKKQIVSALKETLRKASFYAVGRQWPSHVDPVLTAVFNRHRDCSKLADPLMYAQIVAGCIEHMRFDVRVVKAAENSSSQPARRFSFLLELLRDDVPPVNMEGALRIADVSDNYLQNFRALDGEWATDISWHCRRSSSFGRKGRLLAACVRCMRPKRCLELGTAYGLSALFILNALAQLNEGGRLSTIEGFEPCFVLAQKTLDQQFGNAVTCHEGNMNEVLDPIAKAAAPIDFMFHDAGHSEEAYIKDFRTAEPYLAGGAVLMVDDINWSDAHGAPKSSGTYSGWTNIVNHPRVSKAVEIDGIIGLALLT